MKSVGILGLGRYVPSKTLTNLDLEKIVDTNDEWIRTRTGIEERRVSEIEETTSDLAYRASVDAIQNADIDKEDIELIIVATVTAEQRFPSIANIIQEKLNIKNVPSFDLSAACSGFIYATVIAKQFVESGTYKNVLVVGSETLSSITDWDDRNTCVLFGDGAGAAIIGEVSKGKGILSFELGSDGSGGKHLYNDPLIKMNGREVFKFAVRQMGESSINVVEKAGLSKEDINYIVPHQANIRIMESARERLGLPKEKMSVTVNKFGNTSSASIPMSLYEDVKNNKIKDGDNVVLVGFGGGLTWGAICLKWGK